MKIIASDGSKIAEWSHCGSHNGSKLQNGAIAWRRRLQIAEWCHCLAATASNYRMESSPGGDGFKLQNGVIAWRRRLQITE